MRRHQEEASDDLPGDLLRLKAEGAEISDDEIAGVLYSVLFAGHETTTTLMANGLGGNRLASHARRCRRRHSRRLSVDVA